MNNSIFKGLALAGTLMVNNMQGEICSKCGQAYNDLTNAEVKEWCGKCCKNCGKSGQALNYGYCNDCKSKWQLTVDFIMIVGKYFETTDDFVNVMKVCKKYRWLAGMYKFNPISDISLFANIQTLHLYKPEDAGKLNNTSPKYYKIIAWFSKHRPEIDINLLAEHSTENVDYRPKVISAYNHGVSDPDYHYALITEFDPQKSKYNKKRHTEDSLRFTQEEKSRSVTFYVTVIEGKMLDIKFNGKPEEIVGLSELALEFRDADDIPLNDYFEDDLSMDMSGEVYAQQFLEQSYSYIAIHIPESVVFIQPNLQNVYITESLIFVFANENQLKRFKDSLQEFLEGYDIHFWGETYFVTEKDFDPSEYLN